MESSAPSVIWGLSVGSGRNDKSVLCMIKHFPQGQRIFVVQVVNFQKSDSPDEAILEALQMEKNPIALIVDGPLNWPSCAVCACPVTKAQDCPLPSVQWMIQQEKTAQKGRPLLGLAPYLQRPVEYFLNSISKGRWHVDVTFGANVAFKAARLQYLKKRLPAHVFLRETFVPVAVFGLSQMLGLTRSQALSLLNLAQGPQLRSSWIQKATQQWGLFVYDSDWPLLTENAYGFKALVAALTGFVGLVQKKVFQDWPVVGMGEEVLLPPWTDEG